MTDAMQDVLQMISYLSLDCPFFLIAGHKLSTWVGEEQSDAKINLVLTEYLYDLEHYIFPQN